MAKYRVGDKVRIVSSKDGILRWNDLNLMDKWLGKVMTIIEVNEEFDTRYYMKEDAGEWSNGPSCGWTWYEDMIECKVNYQGGDDTNMLFEFVPNEELKVCEHCGRVIGNDENYYETHDGNYVCEECLEEYTKCCVCGKWVLNDDVVEVNDGCSYVCPECAQEYYFECNICGGVYHRDYAYYDPDGNEICEDCYYEQCTTCAECGRTIWNDEARYNDDDGEYYCEECYEENVDNLIMSYHEFSDWELHSTGNETKYSSLPAGIELEVERCSSSTYCDEMAQEINSIVGDLAVFEHDGSLNDGFEIITQPMTYDYWANSAMDKITSMLGHLKDNGYKSHDTSTCGLHIHVARNSLATSKRSTDEVIDNIILIMETFKAELVAFSRRRNEQIDRWARFLTSECDDINLSYVKSLKTGDDRYLALNLAKRATIEFRIFKGTLIKETLYASIELVKNIVNIAKFESLDGLTWSDIINYHKSVNKYLTQYNEARGISSDTKLHILDKFEMNKENYSLQNFVDGKFAILFRTNDNTTSKTAVLQQMIFKNVKEKIENISLFDILDEDYFNFEGRYASISDKRIIAGSGSRETVGLQSILNLWNKYPELLCA